MAEFEVIADVSSTLEAVLTEALSSLGPAPAPVAEVHGLDSAVSTTPARLTLFLFEIVEDPSQRNRPPTVTVDAAGMATRKPPIALLLRYLVTPWSGDRLTDHKILGRAMQVLYDGAILSGPQLRGGLRNGDAALKVTMAPLTLEERTRVWHAVQKPYRLSVTYEIRVVNLEPERRSQRTPVRNRVLDNAVPDADVAAGAP